MNEEQFIGAFHDFVVSKIGSALAKSPSTTYKYKLVSGSHSNTVLRIEIDAGTRNWADSKVIVKECIDNLDSHPQGYKGQGWRSNAGEANPKPFYGYHPVKNADISPTAWSIYAEEKEIAAVFQAPPSGVFVRSTTAYSFDYQGNRLNANNNSSAAPAAAPAPAAPSPLTLNYINIVPPKRDMDKQINDVKQLYLYHKAVQKVVACDLAVSGMNEISQLNFIINQKRAPKKGEELTIKSPSAQRSSRYEYLAKKANKPGKVLGQQYKKRNLAGHCFAFAGFTFEEVKELNSLLQAKRKEFLAISDVRDSTKNAGFEDEINNTTNRINLIVAKGRSGGYKDEIFSPAEIRWIETALGLKHKFVEKIHHTIVETIKKPDGSIEYKGTWNGVPFDEWRTFRDKSRYPGRWEKLQFLKKNASTLKPTDPTRMKDYNGNGAIFIHSLDKIYAHPNNIYDQNAYTDGGSYPDIPTAFGVVSRPPVPLTQVQNRNNRAALGSQISHNEILFRYNTGMPEGLSATKNDIPGRFTALRVMYKTKYRTESDYDVPVKLADGQPYSFYIYEQQLEDVLSVLRDQVGNVRDDCLNALFSQPDDTSYEIKGDNLFKKGTPHCFLQEIILSISNHAYTKNNRSLIAKLDEVASEIIKYQALPSTPSAYQNIRFTWPKILDNKMIFQMAYLNGGLSNLLQASTSGNSATNQLFIGDFKKPRFFDYFLENCDFNKLVQNGENPSENRFIFKQFLRLCKKNISIFPKFKEFILEIKDFSQFVASDFIDLYTLDKGLFTQVFSHVLSPLKAVQVNELYRYLVNDFSLDGKQYSEMTTFILNEIPINDLDILTLANIIIGIANHITSAKYQLNTDDYVSKLLSFLEKLADFPFPSSSPTISILEHLIHQDSIKTCLKNIKTKNNFSLLDVALNLEGPIDQKKIEKNKKLVKILIDADFSADQFLNDAINNKHLKKLQRILEVYIGNEKLAQLFKNNNARLLEVAKLLTKSLSSADFSQAFSNSNAQSTEMTVWRFYVENTDPKDIDSACYLGCQDNNMLENVFFQDKKMKKYFLDNEKIIVRQALSHNPQNLVLVRCLLQNKIKSSRNTLSAQLKNVIQLSNPEINIEDKENTVLHLALEDNNKELLKIILSNAAPSANLQSHKDILKKNTQNISALELAFLKHDFEAVEILLTADQEKSHSIDDDFSSIKQNNLISATLKNFIVDCHYKYVLVGPYKSILDAAYSQNHIRLFSFFSQVNESTKYFNLSKSNHKEILAKIVKGGNFSLLHLISDNIIIELNNAEKSMFICDCITAMPVDLAKGNIHYITKIFSTITNFKLYADPVNNFTALHHLAELSLQSKDVFNFFLEILSRDPEAINIEAKIPSEPPQTVFSVFCESNYEGAKALLNDKKEYWSILGNKDLNDLLKFAVKKGDIDFVKIILASKLLVTESTAKDIFAKAIDKLASPSEIFYEICHARPELIPILLAELKKKNIAISTLSNEVIQLFHHDPHFHSIEASQHFNDLVKKGAASVITFIDGCIAKKESYNELFNEWFLNLAENFSGNEATYSPILLRLAKEFANKDNPAYIYLAKKNKQDKDALLLLTPYLNECHQILGTLIAAGANPYDLSIEDDKCAVDAILGYIEIQPIASNQVKAFEVLEQFVKESKIHPNEIARLGEWLKTLCGKGQFNIASKLLNSFNGTIDLSDNSTRELYLEVVNTISKTFTPASAQIPGAKAAVENLFSKLLTMLGKTPLDMIGEIDKKKFDQNSAIQFINLINLQNWDAEKGRNFLEFCIANEHWNCVQELLTRMWNTKPKLTFIDCISIENFVKFIQYFGIDNKSESSASIPFLIELTTQDYSKREIHDSQIIHNFLFKELEVGVNFLKCAVDEGYTKLMEWLCVQGVDPLLDSDNESALDRAVNIKKPAYVTTLLKHASHQYHAQAVKNEAISDIYHAGKFLAGQFTPENPIAKQQTTPVASLDIKAKRAFALGAIQTKLKSFETINEALEYATDIENRVPEDIKSFLFERQGSKYSLRGHRFGDDKDISETGAKIYKLCKNRLLELANVEFNQTNDILLNNPVFSETLQNKVADFLSTPRKRTFLNLNIRGSTSSQIFSLFSKGKKDQAQKLLEKEKEKTQKWLSKYSGRGL